MPVQRVEKHPILTLPDGAPIRFTFDGKSIESREGEVVSSALFANGIKIFGHHHKDGAPQGIFCSNGQCSQCVVIANGVPVKACMTPVKPGMRVNSCNGKPELPTDNRPLSLKPIPEVETEVLIIGGGPSGLSAAIELGEAGVSTILIDDKQSLGGKLTLQTHIFFGSRKECHAGVRGIDIAGILVDRLRSLSSVKVWLNSPAIGVFEDGKIGIVKDGKYVLVRPDAILVATGARERTLSFPGSDLPGVYGAGAFQTLVNRDLIRPADRLFICGGGNVGLIAAYHAIQASIEVSGLVEAAPSCGGYKVHLDKILRLGVPVFTSHTIVEARGKEHLTSITITQVDKNFKPLPDTRQTFDADALLIAVGLSPVNEILLKARHYGLAVYAAGDAEEISEASAAMISGKIEGHKIIKLVSGKNSVKNNQKELLDMLKMRPGQITDSRLKRIPGGIYPVIRCSQEIPCDPCAEVCPKGAITIPGGRITGIPVFSGTDCSGCGKCVLECPGLAINLVDERYDKTAGKALLSLPFELGEEIIRPGDEVTAVTTDGRESGKGKVLEIKSRGQKGKRKLLLLEVPSSDAEAVAGIRIQNPEKGRKFEGENTDENTIICRCERITKKEIVSLIRNGYRDMNQIKGVLRTGMGACGGKTCREQIVSLFKQEGVDLEEVTDFVNRPPEMEVPLKLFEGRSS